MPHEVNAGAPSRRETTTAGQRDKNLSPRRSERRGNTEKYLFENFRWLRQGCGDNGSVQCLIEVNAGAPGRRETTTAGQRDKNLSPRRSERRGNTEKYLFENFRRLRQEMRRQRIGSMPHEVNAGAPVAGKNNQSALENSSHGADFENRDAMDVRSFNAAASRAPKNGESIQSDKYSTPRRRAAGKRQGRCQRFAN